MLIDCADPVAAASIPSCRALHIKPRILHTLSRLLMQVSVMHNQHNSSNIH